MEAYAEQLEARLPDLAVQLARTPQQERQYAENARIITGSTLDPEVLERATDLRWFAGTTSGYNHLPLEELRDRGVAVTNASGIHAPGIAEQAIANILVFARNLHVGWQQKQGAQWRHYQAGELQGKTVTIVGLGSIGTAVEERIRGFGVETIGIRYTPSKGGPTDEVVGFDLSDVHAAFAQSDYVVLAAPLSETTEGLVNHAEFETLPPTAVLINTARGGLVNTSALVRALQEEMIRGAALDVTDPEPLPPDHPLWSLDNALITPHMGGSTPKHWSRLADIVQENVRHVEETGTYVGLKNQVLSPE
ncbi:D-2-hydroxyacid dehydrogenase [Salinigranum halophilum]|jgi:phosphoglycerate dehydrogenase-like enzyme|uniref:D-2-hydroxyacid dehydrogenase n=1 Tax=Salinigranum halophilum TaxID=2565931 RepID=UPI0010A79748|nr:D-2-hydroxyacid dehydrogenase [Salinigranum halophilum]